MSAFKQLVIIINPAATSADTVSERVERLSALFKPDAVATVPTSSRQSANEALLRQHKALLGPETLLAIAAGDGTTSLVIESLLTDEALSDNQRRSVVLPLWGGNSNDLAHMLNGPAGEFDPHELLQSDRYVTVHPLYLRLTAPDGTVQTRLAINYASFGASAAAAHKINDPDHRDDPLREIPAGRAVSELAVVAGAMLKSPRFTLVENGQESHIYERVIINGSRMAKTDAVPLKLTDKHFYQITVEHKLATALARRALQMTNPDTAPRFAATESSFTLKDSVWAQLDGESVQLDAGTQVEVTVFKQPFHALSRLL